MPLEQLLDRVPDYARDLKLNLASGLQQTELTEQQAWGTAVASAMAARGADVLQAILAEAARHLAPQALLAAKTAAAIMGMNNIFYRFRHFAGNEKYGTLPARLRMQVIRSHGADPVDFELWCLAVSAVNGCGVCVDAHEKAIREKGVSEETVLAAIRIAATIHALAGVMEAESLATQPVHPPVATA